MRRRLPRLLKPVVVKSSAPILTAPKPVEIEPAFNAPVLVRPSRVVICAIVVEAIKSLT